MVVTDVSGQGDPLKEEVIAAVARVAARVEGIESVLAQIEDLDDSVADKRVSCSIAADMGTVVVDGNGQLVGVRLNSDAFGSGDIARLGVRLVAAINAARDQVGRSRGERIDELARNMWQ